MLGLFIAYPQIPMGGNLDSLFLFPRALLTSRKVDLYDAINLVIYAKLPLISVRRGEALVAGFIRRDGVRVVPALMSAHQKDEILGEYGSEIALFRYPIGPSQYEPLLERMVEAGEDALPYFFHEHHQLGERRRRAAMFADLHGELAGLVGTKEVALQVTESERTYLMDGSAWMTAETLRAFLERHGVSPWWQNEENLESHARLERLLLSDGLAVSRSELSNGYDEDQLPSYLFGKMLLSRTSAPRGYSFAREPARSDKTADVPMTDGEFADSYYKPGKRKANVESLRKSDHPNEEASSDDDEPNRSAMTPLPKNTANPDLSKDKRDTGAGHMPGERGFNRRDVSSIAARNPDDAMLSRQGVADLLGRKSANTTDNYANRFPDFPKAHGITKMRSKREVEAWLELHRDDL